jgi:L-asparaginase
LNKIISKIIHLVIRINTAAPKKSTSSVLIIYTGGTLGMAYDEVGKHLRPFDFSQILEKVPELSQLACELTVYSLPEIIDSSNMHPCHWIEMANIIRENYDDYDGFVVLHGTDTMVHSASALSYLLENLAKPVIFTGAQLPIGAIRTDARRNLITSIQVAEAKIAGKPIVPEVCIFFNDLLLRGNRSKKEESANFDAFQSENYPSLAKVGIHISYFDSIIMSSPTQALKVHQALDENVTILKLFPGISSAVVKSVLSIKGLKGIVLETYGSGNAPTEAWFLELIQEAIDHGLTILNVSQCLGGQVLQGRYETSTALAKMGVIGGSDLTSEAAITKLMFLLAQNLSKEELAQQLSHSLRGELTEI